MGATVSTAGAGVSALLLGLLLTEPLRRLALRHGITDRPSARKAHTRPTPYLGGVAVAAATLAAGGTAALAGDVLDPVLGVLLGGAALMCVLGLIDDLRPLAPALRLCVETSAAVVVVLTGGHPDVFGGAWDAALAVAWIVFLTNAFNLLDNTDGVASSLCVVIGGFLCLTAPAGGSDGPGVVVAALAGACLGFLFHNRHPARIFLGDAGSLSLGFTLASVMVVRYDDVQGPAGPVSLLLATLVPTLDTTLVVLSRYRESRPVTQGGTDHIAHRLRRLGLSVPQVVRCLALFTLAGCVSAVLVTHGRLDPGVALGSACVVGACAVRLLLGVPATGATAPGGAVPRATPTAGIARLVPQLRPAGAYGHRHRTVRQPPLPRSREAGRKDGRLSAGTGAPITSK
ncbi:MraY family glycosyltransferase [Streptomyces sp. NPDC003753]|uniref:MraY family glycosyltransferase n=1 Tax=Streptomyces sp. NPDC058960 TaxID=3346679 RepID=UPI0036CAE8BB